jgi:RNA polymerase sigma-70 factor (ECF subfamily)
VVDQLTHKEIASLLKISEGTSKSQLNKARVYLKKLIDNQNNINNEFRKRG